MQEQTPKALTADEAKMALVRHVRGLTRYWYAQDDLPGIVQFEGLAYNILSLIDGYGPVLPEFALTPKASEVKPLNQFGFEWPEEDLSGKLGDLFKEELVKDEDPDSDYSKMREAYTAFKNQSKL